MKRASRILSAAIFICSLTYATDTNWRIDGSATALEIVKLSVITAVPIALFLGAGFSSQEYRLPFIIAGSVTAVPAIAGITLFTIDIINYDPNKDPKTASIGTEIRATIRYCF